MAIIVEDGTIVVDANSYGDIARADDYFTFERPNGEDWLAFTDVAKEASLRYTAKLLKDECWRGRRAQPNTQTLSFPRTELWYHEGERFFRPDEIPEFIICAQFEFALALAREDRLRTLESVGGGQGLSRVKVDVIEVAWQKNAEEIVEETKKLMPDIVKRLICAYITNCGKGITVPLLRG